MQTYIMNRNSWFYKMAKFGGFNDWSSQDICTYRTAILLAMVKAPLFFFLGILGSVVVGNIIVEMIFSLGFSVVYWSNMFTIEGILGWAFLLSGSLTIFVLVVIPDLAQKRRYTKWNARKQDSFIKTAYKSYKDKYCVKIEFVD